MKITVDLVLEIMLLISKMGNCQMDTNEMLLHAPRAKHLPYLLRWVNILTSNFCFFLEK
jgi:hypothetical protein